MVPPSESKRPPPESGRPVALDELSFPELMPVRSRILDALIETSGRPDAFERLQVRPSMVHDVLRNIEIAELATRPVLEVYTGPLHAGLDAATLSPGGARRAATRVIVISSLWGALRPTDRIPAYRLHSCARLVGIDRLERCWRAVLPDVLGRAAGSRGVVVDLRSPSYQALGMPAGAGDRTVMLHVRQRVGHGCHVGDVVAKRMRGQAARLLLESGASCEDPVEVAAILAERWPLDLRPPERPGQHWRISLTPDA